MDYKGFVYEWTNSINEMKYIGSHVGVDTDGYTGGGIAFRKDLKLYGVNSFTRKILEYVKDIDDLPTIEKKYLEEVDARNNANYYNRTNGSSTCKKEKLIHERDVCKECNINAQAVNYKDSEGIVHYRKLCSSCLRKGKKLKPLPPPWAKSGYKKKPQCEKCGFKFKLTEQSNVFYIEGNLKNNNWVNLKTVCLNCQREVYKSQMGWKAGPIVPDF